MKVCPENYVARITNATPLQLVIINYEIIINYLNCAKKFANNKEDKKFFEFNICKARDFLGELRANLNMTYEISYNLMSIYNYIDKLLAFSLFNKKIENIEQSIKFMEKILSSWVEIQEDEEDKTPSMENVQQIFSGITYNKKGFLDEYVEVDTKRGFKA